MIKNFKFIFLFAAVVGMTACSDDSSGGSSTDGDLLGTWIYSEMTMDGSSTMEMGGQTMTSNYGAVATSFNDAQVVFMDDNTIASTGSVVLELTIETMGQSISQEFEDNNLLGEGTYEKNGNTLTLTANGTAVDYTIVQLDENTLRLTTDQYEAMGAMPMDVDVTTNLTFTRM